MIEGKLHETQPALVTQSKIGCDYLELRMELDTGEKIHISMPTGAMKLLGTMMAKVAYGIEQRNLKRN